MSRYTLEQIGVTSDYYLIDNERIGDDKIIDMIRWEDTSENILQLLNQYDTVYNQLLTDLIDKTALIDMLEDCKGLTIEDLLYNCTYSTTEEEFNDLYEPFLRGAKRKWQKTL